jgi:hypothetical protein
MIQKHRISTNIGKDQKVTVELKQDFDLLEILSLKFTQQDIYTSRCSDYGVVCGRVTANNGLGIPNARVSIFVPQKESDIMDPIISALYPYTDLSVKDDNQYRYNLLPSRQQHGGHTATGTFPDQSDILTREEVLEVFESYYRYTVKTNDSGDFMIWGVPVGDQNLHVDVDLSDIGCFSLRPYDFIKKGMGADNFDRFYKFDSSNDIDSLPQIVSFDKIIQVYPFWGNESLCEIGITRSDFDISEMGIKIEPISLILASSITDDDSDAVKRTGVIRRNTGYKCNLQTTTGRIECVRQTGRKVYGSDNTTLYPELEYYNVKETFDINGVAMIVLPMNLEYYYTNEFGEMELTNDHNKGVPTTTIARFRLSLDAEGEKVTTGKYLIPQIREFNESSDGLNLNSEYHESLLTTYIFSNVFEDYLKIPEAQKTDLQFQLMGNDGFNLDEPTTTAWRKHKTELMLGTKNNGIPEDVFYKFTYGKVYTPSSFQGSHYEVSWGEEFLGLSRRDAFLGIKEIRPNAADECSNNANYVPTNFVFRNRLSFGLLLSEILLFLQYIFTVGYIWLVEAIGGTLWSIARYIGPFNPFWAGHPFFDIAASFIKLAYDIQEAGQIVLPLTMYPDCEECTTDTDTGDPSNNTSFVIEQGCAKYDKFYNEDLVYAYMWTSGSTYGTNSFPSNESNINGPEWVYDTINSLWDYFDAVNPWHLLGKPNYRNTQFTESLTSPGPGWTLVSAIVGSPGRTVTFGSGQYAVSTFNTDTQRLPNKVNTWNGVYTYNKKTKSGLTEIRDGVITVVPVIVGESKSVSVIKEWYNRKRIGVFFCGGVANYSFVDNWLHGLLYFFKFDKKISWDDRPKRDMSQWGSKYPRELVFFNPLDEMFYYRATPYDPYEGFKGQTITTKYLNNFQKEILHPTTFYDVGVRDEFLYEICQDPKIDPACSVIRDITATSYQDPAKIVEYAINYRLDTTQGQFELSDFFTGVGLGDNVKVFDGDITQLMSINCEAGIEAFDLDSSHYFMYNGELMDPEDINYKSYFTDGSGNYGPTPIDLKLDANGKFIRECLNFRLGDFSQKVPFFLWDKLGTGFGSFDVNWQDDQHWDRTRIASMPLQRLFSISDVDSRTPNYVMANGEEEFLLKPMTKDHSQFSFTGNTPNSFERFEVIKPYPPTGTTEGDRDYYIATDFVEGDLWLHVEAEVPITKEPISGTTYVVLWDKYFDNGDGTLGAQIWTSQGVKYVSGVTQSFIYETVNNYTGNKQVLSTPFLFYFGIRPQNTAIDLLIKYYGPKGAFPPAE